MEAISNEEPSTKVVKFENSLVRKCEVCVWEIYCLDTYIMKVSSIMFRNLYLFFSLNIYKNKNYENNVETQSDKVM